MSRPLGSAPLAERYLRAPGAGRWLAGFAAAVLVGMQAGTIFKSLGSLGSTRVADWVDLLTPYAVLGCAAMVLVAARAAWGAWALFGVGAVTFTLGHGIHLAANSVSNVADPVVADASVVHVWDEVVSHWIWYPGLVLVLGSLVWALRGLAIPVGPGALTLAGVVALTLVNTYIEGGTAVLGLVTFLISLVLGVRWRPEPVSYLLRVVGGVGLVLLVGWGVFWLVSRGSWFPEFSELGWI